MILDPGRVWSSYEKWRQAAVDLARKFINNFNNFSLNEETLKLQEYGPVPG
jgi:ATP-dependent phosphoenolpyruvate carboxykinase